MRSYINLVLAMLTALLLIVWSGCGEEDKAVDTLSGSSSSAAQTAEEYKSVTLGIEAGEYKILGMTINVPEGAFSAPQQLEIKKLKDAGATGIDGSRKQVYSVFGLDRTQMHKNITITLPYTGSTEAGVKDYLAIVTANRADSFSYGVTDALELAEGVKGEGTLKATITPIESSVALQRKKRDKTVIETRFWGIPYFVTLTDDGAFAIKIPADVDLNKNIQIVDFIKESLSEASSKLHSYGFSWSALPQPYQVIVTNSGLGKNKKGKPNDGLCTRTFYSPWTDSKLLLSKDFLVTNITNAKKQKELKATIGHEFFHAVQGAYIPKNSYLFSKPTFLMEASSMWFEYAMVNDPSKYLPDLVSGNSEFQNIGLDKAYVGSPDVWLSGKGKSYAEDDLGYGASIFLKYLTTALQDDGLIYKIWTLFHRNLSDLKAIETAVAQDDPSGLEQKWSDFAIRYNLHQWTSEYISQASWQTPAAALKYDIDKKNGEAFSKTFSMGKYSALHFQIYDMDQLHHDASAHDLNISFQLKDEYRNNFQAYIYKWSSSLKKHVLVTQIDMLKGWALLNVNAKENYKIIIINTVKSGVKDVKLNISQVKNQKMKTTVYLNIDPAVFYYCQPGHGCKNQDSSLALHFKATGNFDSQTNIFTGTLVSLMANETVSGTMKITLSPDRERARLHIMEDKRHMDGFYSEHTEIDTGNISAYDDLKYVAHGNALSSVRIKYKKTYNDGRTDTYLSSSPGKNSKIEIRMSAK